MATGDEVLKVVCPKCGESLLITGDKAGRVITCTKCAAQLMIKTATEASADEGPKTRVLKPGEVPPGPDADPLIGAVVGGCKVLERVGMGGMGVVYKAKQLKLNRTVVLKVMHPELVQSGKNYVDRYVTEARILAQISNPNIVQVYDVGQQEGYCYVVREYIEGQSVKGLLWRKGKIPPKEALAIIIQAAKGLEAAHHLGAIHRDIKPVNLLINKRGVVKISDFALAWDAAAGPQGGPSVVAMGSPEYMAPEQCKVGKVDARTDIYSLGVTLFEMLTGKVPYEGRNAQEIMYKHLQEPIPDTLRKDKSIPPSLAGLVERMMAKNPDDRFQNTEELVAALGQALNELRKEAVRRGQVGTVEVAAPAPTQAAVPVAPAPLPTKEPEPAPPPAMAPPPEPEREQPGAGTVPAAVERARMRRQAVPRKSLVTTLIAMGVLIALAGGIAGLILLTAKSEPEPSLPPPKSAVGSATAEDKTKPGAKEPQAEQSAATEKTPLMSADFAAVVNYMKQNPENYKEICNKLKQFIQENPDTDETATAKKEMKRVEAEWEKKAATEVAGIERLALQSARGKNYAQAFDLLNKFPDNLKTQRVVLDLIPAATQRVAAEAGDRLKAEVEALLADDKYAEIAEKLDKCGKISEMQGAVSNLWKMVEKHAQDKLQAVRADMADAVPELKSEHVEGAAPTPLSTLLDFRAKLDRLKGSGIRSIVDAVNEDLHKLAPIEAAAASREIEDVVERARVARDEVESTIRAGDLAKAEKRIESLIADLDRFAKRLDEKTARPVKDERNRCTEVLADIQLLNEIRDLAIPHLADLKGKEFSAGSISGTLEKVEEGKVYLGVGGGVVTKGLDEIPLKYLAPIARKYQLDAQKLLRQNLLLAVYFGTQEEGRKAIADAKKAGVDVERYEVVLGGARGDSGKARSELAAKSLLAKVRVAAKEGNIEELRTLLQSFSDKYSDTDTYKEARKDFDQLKFEAASKASAVELWMMAGGNPQHVSRSRYKGPGENTLKWSFETGGQVSSPVIGPDGSIYVGTTDSSVYAISRDGEKRWIAKTGGAVWCTPAVDLEGTVYVTCSDGKLYAFGKDGKTRWTASPAEVASPPTIGPDGLIHVGANNGRLYTLGKDEKQRGYCKVISGEISAPAAIGLDGTFYVSSSDGLVYAFNKERRPVWSCKVGPTPGVPVVGADGTIYVSCGDLYLYAVKNGKKEWRFKTDSAPGQPALGADGTIYVGSDDGYLYAIPKDGGKERWKAKAGGAIKFAPAVGADGTIYVGADDGCVYAFDSSGKELWTFKTGGKISSSPAIGPDGVLYVGSKDRKLYALWSGEAKK